MIILTRCRGKLLLVVTFFLLQLNWEAGNGIGYTQRVYIIQMLMQSAKLVFANRWIDNIHEITEAAIDDFPCLPKCFVEQVH